MSDYLTSDSSYNSMANRLSEIAGRQAESAKSMGLVTSELYFQNQQKLWGSYATQVPTGSPAFGLAPQIFNTASELAWLNDPRAGTGANGEAFRNAFGGDYHLQAPMPLGGGVQGESSGPYDATDYSINPNQYVARGSIFNAYNNGNSMTQGDWNSLTGDHTIAGGADTQSAVARLYSQGGGENVGMGNPTEPGTTNPNLGWLQSNQIPGWLRFATPYRLIGGQ